MGDLRKIISLAAVALAVLITGIVYVTLIK